MIQVSCNPAWWPRLHGGHVCIVVASAWWSRLHGGHVCMVATSAWWPRLHGGHICMVATSATSEVVGVCKVDRTTLKLTHAAHCQCACKSVCFRSSCHVRIRSTPCMFWLCARKQFVSGLPATYLLVINSSPCLAANI
jgi:hypothetical protein